jgi:hypothetical protein
VRNSDFILISISFILKKKFVAKKLREISRSFLIEQFRSLTIKAGIADAEWRDPGAVFTTLHFLLNLHMGPQS